MQDNKKHRLHGIAWISAGLIPVILVFFLYGPTRDYGLVWDDHVLTTASIYENHNIVAILTSPANGYEYLPVRDLSLALDYAVHGRWWGGFHQTNIILFALGTFLAYLFYIRLFTSSLHEYNRNTPFLLALASALLFSLHPLNVEPVAFIATRNAVLALCFCLAACLSIDIYEQSGSRALYWLGLALLVFALLSKATVVFLPIVFILLAMYRNGESTLSSAICRYTPHLAVTAIIFILHLLVASRAALGVPLSLGAIPARLHNIIFIPEFYLYKAVWPLHLVIDYPYSEYFEHKLLLILGSGLLFFFVFRLFRGEFRNRTTVWLLMLAYFASLLPVMNLIPTSPPVADRYAQIPLIFLVPLMLLLVSRWLNVKFLVIISLLACVALSYLTTRQIEVWESDSSLFNHTLASYPRSVKALHNLGIRLWIEGDKEKSLSYFKRAAEVNPQDLSYDYYLGRYAEDNGDTRDAIAHYRNAVSKQGQFLYLAYLKLGLMQSKEGDYSNARKALSKSIELAGTSPQDMVNKRAASDAIAHIDRIQGQHRTH